MLRQICSIRQGSALVVTFSYVSQSVFLLYRAVVSIVISDLSGPVPMADSHLINSTGCSTPTPGHRAAGELFKWYNRRNTWRDTARCRGDDNAMKGLGT